MNDPDETGWSPIHHCAYRGYIKSLERFVDNDPDCLELQTHDDLGSTPFLLAVSAGLQDPVTCLIHLGAKVDVVNSQNHGAVEICAIKQFFGLLDYLLQLQLPTLPVWRNLLKMLGSDMEEEVFSAGTCLRNLTEPAERGVTHPHWLDLYNNGAVPIICKTAKSTVADESKVPVLQFLLNLIQQPEVREDLVSGGGAQAMVQLLKSADRLLVQLAAQVIGELGQNREHSELLMRSGAIPALHHVLQAVPDPEVRTAALRAIASIAATGPKQKETVGNTPGCIESIVQLFETATGDADLQLALTHAVSCVAQGSENNQNAFVNAGVTQHVVNIILTQTRNKEVQASAVAAVQQLAEDNPHCQHHMLELGADRLLLQVLRKRPTESLLERTATALWAMAGTDVTDRKEMAAGLGIQTLVEFVNSASEDLQLIGSEGLGVLAQGPLNQQSQIAAANGIHPLVRLLKSDQEHIVLSVIRSLRHLCVSVGNVPCPANQNTIATSRGVKLLLALMVHSLDEEIQAEAALTLASVSLGNAEVLEEVHGNLDFSYVRLLKMLYADHPEVRLMAGSALAAFAYNNLQQQRHIADQGGVRFGCFLPFLSSRDERHRCAAAYQVVVLARIIPDVEQTVSSATGIKLLVDCLGTSTNNDVRAMAADFIACLAHTRAGIPSALVAVRAVKHLCDLLISPSDQVRGHAAVALSYLSHNHVGQRHLLNRCRKDPYLTHVIKHFTKPYKLATSFIEGWNHCKKVGLPPIPEGRPSLVRSKLPRDDIGPIAVFNLEDSSQGSGRLRGNMSTERTEQMTGRSSRVSHQTHQSHQSRSASQLSAVGSQSHVSLPEIRMVEEA